MNRADKEKTMKRIKKITSLLLAILILFSCIPVSVSAEEYTYCKKGDIIEFGNYPQTKVTDENLLAELDAIEKNWQSLNYYMGTDDSTKNTMFPSDYTKYYDFEYNNEKYRAIYFTMYRPSDVHGSTFRAGQYGYDLNTVYYFKYEPIKWKVLDPDTGFVVSDVLLDSQPFTNEYYYDSDTKKYYTDETLSVYANNYELSSIRKWLNDDFYNASFSSEQKSDIITSIVNNDNIEPSYSSAETEDNIFILSQKEFNKYDEELLGTDNDYKVNATDYAMCQGLPKVTLTNTNGTYIGYSWLLRTAANNNGRADTVKSIYVDGQSENVYIYKTNLGIRPACRLNGLKSNDTSEYKTGDIIEFGNYPQTKVTDENLLAELNAIEKDWVSYNYYMGTDDTNSAENINSAHPSDYAKYCDLVYNNEKYRAVYFTMYRSMYTYSVEYHTGQHSYGYHPDNVYYFKYEPIKWKILDPNTGLVVSDIILDSQAYNNEQYYSGSYYRDETRSAFANNYELSSIRQWLNDDFYNTSFSVQQKSNIAVSTLNNEALYESYASAAETNDNIFLLSVKEFNKYLDDLIFDDNYTLTATDYARCQGLTIRSTITNTYWLSRSASTGSEYICVFAPDGELKSMGEFSYETGHGIRPACRLSVLKSDTDIDTQPDNGNDDKEINSNISWTYDGNCRLYISGNGAINYADSYGWEQYSDEIMYVEIGDGITALPENIFSNMPYLTEVYLGSDIETIANVAFADCPLLTAVTFNSNTEISKTAFANAGQDLTFILNGSTELPETFAESNGIKTVMVSYDESKKILSFSGDVTVFDYTKYYSLNNILYQFKDTEYLYFTKLIFVDADPNINIQDDEIDSEVTPRGLILNNVYISLVHISEDGNRQNVSFAKMLEMLENDDYTAFKYHAKSDEQEEEGTLISKIVDNIRRALQFITKLINFIRNLIIKIRK